MSLGSRKSIGVVVVTYASADVISNCLESLLGSDYAELKIVVCDNASPDNSRDLVRQLAIAKGVEFVDLRPQDHASQAQVSAPRLSLISSDENRGFAGGVNLGLAYLEKCPDVGMFWVLNPDCVVQEDTASAYARCALQSGRFGVIGGRTLYLGEAGMIQSDGGRVNLWTGICSNYNVGKMHDKVEMPPVSEVDYISGANLVVSREFLNQAGKMNEDYFLYYEEVDWALRRGDLPIVLCPQAMVLHHAGTSIGSGTRSRAPSAFSNYFNFRSRMIFMRRFRPWALPVAYGFSVLKIAQIGLKVGIGEAYGAWKGLNSLSPPKAIVSRLDAGARKHAFGKKAR